MERYDLVSRRVPILVYHHVYHDDNPELAIATGEMASGVIGISEFRRQMEYVLEGGWQIVSTSQIVDWLEGAGELPEKAVALHFDNGWLDTLTVALPALDGWDATGTCYVISEPTDAASKGLPAGIHTTTEGFVAKPFLTWDHCRELLDAGWEIGAHTATHPKLGLVYDEDGEDALMAEIVPSNGVFGENLGYIPEHFAYPSGSRTDVTDELISPHYRSLRRWSFDQPPVWRFTDGTTSPKALECQNVDNTVAFEHFMRIFDEALEGGREDPARTGRETS